MERGSRYPRGMSGTLGASASAIGLRLVCGGLALGLAGCVPLTREEARVSLEEARLFSEAAALAGATIELGSRFTIGGAVETMARSLQGFYEAELPCAAVSLEGSTLSVEFGALGGPCEYAGRRYTGLQEITLRSFEDERLVVEHSWVDLSNQEISLSGVARVTWRVDGDGSRRVVHDLLWTRESDGWSGRGTGDRTQRALDGDLSTGFTVSGDAEWEGDAGLFSLEIEDVEMRWRDPVPQAGVYRLATPFDRAVEISFERTRATEVRVTATNERKSYEFDVKTPE